MPEQPLVTLQAVELQAVAQFGCYVWLECVERRQNRQRFYRLEWQPLLWGGGALISRWGRIGGVGLSRHQVFADRASAQAEVERQLRRRLRRGYTITSWT